MIKNPLLDFLMKLYNFTIVDTRVFMRQQYCYWISLVISPTLKSQIYVIHGGIERKGYVSRTNCFMMNTTVLF